MAIALNSVPEIPESKLSSSVQSKLNSGGSGNENIRVVTNQTELTTALSGSEKILSIQSDITLTSNITLPTNAIIIYGGGIVDVDTYTVTFVGNDLTNSKWNFFIGSVHSSSTFKGTRSILASDFGALDDNNSSTNNKNAIRQCLNIINKIPSGHLIINKYNTGVYWTLPGTSQEEQNPFYPNVDTTSWLIGVGNNVKVTVEADINIIPNNTKGSILFNLYDVYGAELEIKGTIKGDRFTHNYDQVLVISGAASSAGNVTLEIREQDNWKDTVYTNIIIQTIALTNSNLATNKTEIINAINTLPAFADYTATDAGGNDINLIGQPGVYYRLVFTAGSTGATLSTSFSTYEWGYAIVGGSNSNNIKIHGGGNIIELHGDAFNSDYQGNGNTAITSANMSVGRINSSTGILDTGETAYRTLTTARTVPSPHEWFSFSPNSNAPLDLKLPRYWVSWYTSGDIFIEKSPQLKPFERYRRKPEYAKYKVEVDYNGATDFANFNYYFNSRSDGQNGIIENLTLKDCRRQTVSNPPIGATFRNIVYDGVGGADPMWNVDLEDNTKWQIGNSFKDSTFIGGKGGIIIKGAQKIEISGNRFLQSAYDTDGDPSEFIGGVYTGYGRDINIHDNYFDFRDNTIDIGTIFHHNNQYKGFFTFCLGGSVSSTNIFKDVLIRDGKVTGDNTQNPAGESTSNSYNDLFIINEEWDSLPLIDEYNSINWINTTYKFNDPSSLQWKDASNFPLITLQDTVKNLIRSQRTIPDTSYKGTYTNFTVEGISAQASDLHKVGWTFYCADVNKAKISTSLKFEYGFPKSFDVKDLETAGWLNFLLNQYASDGVGIFHTIRVIGAKIKVPARTDATKGYLVNTFYGGNEWGRVLQTAQDKNVNFEFINCRIESDDLATTRFMYLGHRGTTLFKDCYFAAAASQTVNFTVKGAQTTSTNFRSSNNGVITMIGNRTNGNVSFTMDAGDSNISY